MRITGGIALLITAVWSLIAGSSALVGGGAAKNASEAAAFMAELEATIDDSGEQTTGVLDQLEEAEATSPGLITAGALMLLTGLLALVAGVAVLSNRAKAFSLSASAAGVVGEVLWIVWVGHFVGWAVVKMVIYGIGAAGATRIAKRQ